VEDDLLGLSIEDTSSEPMGAISLGPSTQFSAPSGSIFSSIPSTFPSSQQPAPRASPKPNYDAFASLTSALPSSKPATPVSMAHAQQQHAPSPATIDPFAALVSGSSRPSTPSRQGYAPKPVPPPFATTAQAPAPVSAPADEEWTFESSLPESSVVKVLSSSIVIEFEPRRQPGASSIQITARFSNATPQRITSLHFQVAVEKAYSLHLKPQSGREISPKARNAVSQEILLDGVPVGKGNVVKMRYKVSYELNGQPQEEQGNVPSLGIA